MSLQQGLSGLNAAAKSLDVIGNNIANASTVGFKSSQAQFADMYAASISSGNVVGIGTSLAAVAQQFTQGNVTTTNNALDVAINGTGMFRMSGNRAGNSGDISYTRNGQFQLNKDGYIVANNGLHLTGYQATAGVVGGQLGDIKVDTADMSPKKSTGVAITANFDGRKAVPTDTFPTTLAAVVPATNPPTYTQPTVGMYNNTTSITVYDSLGGSHVGSLYFSKSSPATAAAAAITPAEAAASASSAANAAVAVAAVTNDVLLNAAAAAAAAVAGSTAASVSAAVAAAVPTLAENKSGAIAAVEATLVVAPVAMDAVTGNDINAGLNAAAAAAAALAASTPATVATAVAAEAAATAVDAAAMVVAANAAIPATAAQALIDVNAVVATSLFNGAAAGVPPLGGILKNAATIAAGLVGATPASVAAAVAAAAAKVAAGAAGEYSNDWNIKMIVDGGQYTTGGVINLGRATFDTNGRLTEVSRQDASLPTTGMTGTVAAGWTSGAWDQTQRLTMDFSKLSQSRSNYSVVALTQDGYGAGRMSGINIDAEGYVQGSYTNGKTQTMGQIALASFANVQGLKPIGNNQWVESLESGSAVVGAPGSGIMGVLMSKAVEDSNTDLTQELVGMITAQRIYQANAQTIKTQDQVMQTLVNLK